MEFFKSGVFQGFLGSAMGMLFIFLIKDYFQRRDKKTDTLEDSVKDLTLQMTKNNIQLENLNKNLGIVAALDKDVARLGSKLRRVVTVVEKLAGTPIPAEEPKF